MAINSRKWPWWVYVGIAIVLLVVITWSFTIAYRKQGNRELAQVLAELTAHGRGTHPADLVKLSPPVDAARQERAWELLQRIAKTDWAGGGKSVPVSGRWSSLDQQLHTPGSDGEHSADDLAAYSAVTAADRAAWSALLAEGPVLISAHGWLKQQVPVPEEAGLDTAVSLRIAPVTAVRGLGRAYAVEALRDPAALAELDRLVAALQPSANLIDAILLGAVGGFRDEAWLAAVLRGADPAPWLASHPDTVAATADGLAGDRMMSVGGLHQDLRRGRNLHGPFSAAAISLPGYIQLFGIDSWRYVAGYDLAFASLWYGRFESRMRGDPADLTGMEEAVESSKWQHPLSAVMLPDLRSLARQGILCEARARRLRIAGAVAHAFQATKVLPAHAAAVRTLLPADLLAATPWAPAISYAVLAPGRFRLWSEAVPPAADLLPATDIDQPPAAPASGAYAHGDWWLELDLTATP